MSTFFILLNLPLPYIPLKYLFVDLQVWSRAAVVDAMDLSVKHITSHVSRHTSQIIFYVMSGILLRGSHPNLLPRGKKHIAVCVESTTYEIGARLLHGAQIFFLLV
jgi:hypothetical protein